MLPTRAWYSTLLNGFPSFVFSFVVFSSGVELDSQFSMPNFLADLKDTFFDAGTIFHSFCYVQSESLGSICFT